MPVSSSIYWNSRSHLAKLSATPLVELECLVVPLRLGDTGLIQRYQQFFRQQTLLDISQPVYRLAAELRARHRLKTPDALHLATMQYHGVTEIWTNDERLRQAAGAAAVNIIAAGRPQ